jgi:release factor glutamine methyltransferase
MLDLFAGSGCIGVAVLHHVPNAHVTFGELEARHLPTIQKNIRENCIDPTRTTVVQTNVYSDLGGHYDFILANPPYLSHTRIERVEGSVLAHEPEEALFAEDDGFALIDATLAGLPTHFSPGGQCWIEHEPEHTARLQAAGTTTHKDQYGVERYSVILKP